MKAILYLILVGLDGHVVVDKTTYHDLLSCQAASRVLDGGLVQGSAPFEGAIKERSFCVLQKLPKNRIR